ncbi:hypothetical protein M513_03199 [Trichuris suis]|uniref:Uncharacterized protein n=1 Tax=Trichuris suis TaxID=68888 RepID=A0A085MFS9_9BILA|nr:hypothetical protein M513_03199 [Trichuris suis]
MTPSTHCVCWPWLGDPVLIHGCHYFTIRNARLNRCAKALTCSPFLGSHGSAQHSRRSPPTGISAEVHRIYGHHTDTRTTPNGESRQDHLPAPSEVIPLLFATH